MKHLIVGAGATFAEALAQGCERDACPPLINDFARKTWADYSPSPLLDLFLKERGLWREVADIRELFYELESSGVTNIEKFMEFVWDNRQVEVGQLPPAGDVSGLEISEAGSRASNAKPRHTYWDNLLYHGIGRPIADSVMTCFFQNGVGFKDLLTSKRVAQEVEPGDLVLNLNYDTVFEIALGQLGRTFTYAPNSTQPNQIVVSKPHGSLNMVANDQSFAFGQPEWLGLPQPQGFRSFSGLIPPRLNKCYEQHPIAKLILESNRKRRPRLIVFWGVGLTESDKDLLALYREWASSAEAVEIINPDRGVAEKALRLLDCNIKHFSSLEEWEAQRVH